MRICLLLGAWLLLVGPAWSQSRHGVRMNFRSARIVLTSGHTLDGPVSVHFSDDLLYFAQPDGRVRTLVPAALAAFAVQGQVPLHPRKGKHAQLAYDPTVVRLFLTLPWTPERTNLRPEPLFFEQLSEGPVFLLRRQSLVEFFQTLGPNLRSPSGFGFTTAVRAASAPLPSGYRTGVALHDTFFLALPSGEFRILKGDKDEFLEAFPAQAPQLKAYAKAHKLDFTTAADLHTLVNYVNSLGTAKAP